MARPSLLILSLSPIVSDARVLKQVHLFAQDHAVTTCGYGPAPEGVERHVRIPDEVTSWVWEPKLVITHVHPATYWHNPAIRWVTSHLPRRHFDVILANDVETSGIAHALRPRLGFHADLHEFSSRLNEDDRGWNRHIRPLFEWMLRHHVRRAASVTTVGPRIAREYERVLGRTEVGVVPNAAPFRSDLSPTPTPARIRLVHSGAARRERALEAHIDAAAQAGDRFSLDLYLTQDTTPYAASLVERAARTSNVRVLPPVPYADLVTRLHDYDVGLFSLPPTTFNTRWTLPNKFFDFVQARLGQVIGPSPEMVDLLERWDLGTVAEDFSTEALARSITALTPAAVDAMKSRADAAAAPLSAERLSEPWTRAIDAISERADR